MPQVIMAVTVSGTRGEEKWPPAGAVLDCGDDEAQHLVRAGMAVATSGRKTVPRETSIGSMAQLTISPPIQESAQEQLLREAGERATPAEPVKAPVQDAATDTVKDAVKDTALTTEPVEAPNPLEEIAPRRGPGPPAGKH